MKHLLLLFSICLVLSGCATTSQEMTTADGDHYEGRGTALFSKQDVKAKGQLIIYPNNSGVEFTVGSDSAQDSTEALQSLIALGQILAPLLAPQGTLTDISPLAPQPPTMRDTIESIVRQRIEEELRTRLLSPK